MKISHTPTLPRRRMTCWRPSQWLKPPTSDTGWHWAPRPRSACPRRPDARSDGRPSGPTAGDASPRRRDIRRAGQHGAEAVGIDDLPFRLAARRAIGGGAGFASDRAFEDAGIVHRLQRSQRPAVRADRLDLFGSGYPGPGECAVRTGKDTQKRKGIVVTPLDQGDDGVTWWVHRTPRYPWHIPGWYDQRRTSRPGQRSGWWIGSTPCGRSSAVDLALRGRIGVEIGAEHEPVAVVEAADQPLYRSGSSGEKTPEAIADSAWLSSGERSIYSRGL